MIGETIKRLREEKGWTQEELAEKMGYTSKSTINKIEKNVNDVGQKNIIKFAQVFGVDVSEILLGKPTDVDITATAINKKQEYDPKLVERAMKFLEQYEKQIPAVQDAILRLLKSDQSDL